jgi:hypothetical protein
VPPPVQSGTESMHVLKLSHVVALRQGCNAATMALAFGHVWPDAPIAWVVQVELQALTYNEVAVVPASTAHSEADFVQPWLHKATASVGLMPPLLLPPPHALNIRTQTDDTTTIERNTFMTIS